VEIETNGSISLDAYVRMQHRPTLTMDYKLPSSGMESAMRTDNFRLLEKQDAVKFVAGSADDLNRVREIIGRFGLTERCNVFISPVYGKIEPSEIVEFMTKHGMNDVRLQLQLHKFIWNPSRRGV
jgi:7-carboxy-7-deazaguanine synthase